MSTDSQRDARKIRRIGLLGAAFAILGMAALLLYSLADVDWLRKVAAVSLGLAAGPLVIALTVVIQSRLAKKSRR